MMKVDDTTFHQIRGKYAHLCVEVNLNKPLLPHFCINGAIYNILDEGIHLICFKFGCYDHYLEGCLMEVEEPLQNKEKENQDVGDQENSNRKIVSNEFGPWMITHRPR